MDLDGFPAPKPERDRIWCFENQERIKYSLSTFCLDVRKYALVEHTLEHIMAAKKPPSIPLPKSWTEHVRTAMLHVISLAQYIA